MVFEGRELAMDVAEEAEIEELERRSASPSPAQCSNEDLLKGQMLASGRWSDIASDIVWASPRHVGTKKSLDPHHWAILQSTRQNTIPSDGSLFDLSP